MTSQGIRISRVGAIFSRRPRSLWVSRPPKARRQVGASRPPWLATGWGQPQPGWVRRRRWPATRLGSTAARLGSAARRWPATRLGSTAARLGSTAESAAVVRTAPRLPPVLRVVLGLISVLVVGCVITIGPTVGMDLKLMTDLQPNATRWSSRWSTANDVGDPRRAGPRVAGRRLGLPHREAGPGRNTVRQRSFQLIDSRGQILADQNTPCS